MRFTRRLIAAVALAAVALAVPAALSAIAGWPLPTSMPDWDHVITALPQGDLPATVVIKTLACAVWFIWAQLIWALLWELAAVIRHPHDPPAHHAAPLVPHTVHLGIGRLVAFLIATTVTVAA